MRSPITKTPVSGCANTDTCSNNELTRHWKIESSNSDSFNPTDERTVVGAVQAFDLAIARVSLSAGTKEHVIEHAKSEAHTIDRHRRDAGLLVEKACGEF